MSGFDFDTPIAEREARARAGLDAKDRWLQVAALALGAVLRGARNGDPDCLAAVPRIEALMPDQFRPLCPVPIVPGADQAAAAGEIVVECTEQRGSACAGAQADESFSTEVGA